mmetsp:Transcript_42694/g.68665  ORF Transcript_42694/g.68665 Transcript_42694/m.68665 type:complete len:274 (-) Transcript_42694:150-971(-)
MECLAVSELRHVHIPVENFESVAAPQQAVVCGAEEVGAVHKVHVVVPRFGSPIRHRRGALINCGQDAGLSIIHLAVDGRRPVEVDEAGDAVVGDLRQVGPRLTEVRAVHQVLPARGVRRHVLEPARGAHGHGKHVHGERGVHLEQAGQRGALVARQWRGEARIRRHTRQPTRLNPRVAHIFGRPVLVPIALEDHELGPLLMQDLEHVFTGRGGGADAAVRGAEQRGCHVDPRRARVVAFVHGASLSLSEHARLGRGDEPLHLVRYGVHRRRRG